MKRGFIWLSLGLIALALGVFAFALAHAPRDQAIPNAVATVRTDALNDQQRRLIAAYPDTIEGIFGDRIILKNGADIAWDDGIEGKDHRALLETPDVQDMFSLPYPKDYTYGNSGSDEGAGSEAGAMPDRASPAKNNDPGRFRCVPFFQKMYGSSRTEVEANLVTIEWLPRIQKKLLRVTRINGVDKKLLAVSSELEKLPTRFHPYLKNIGGSYAYRLIQDSARLSMHSFGIALDLNSSLTEYWNWEYKDEMDDIVYHNSLPYEIAAIFERHGFIWGGKWYHFDTMHFEYRPELLVEPGADDGHK